MALVAGDLSRTRTQGRQDQGQPRRTRIQRAPDARVMGTLSVWNCSGHPKACKLIHRGNPWRICAPAGTRGSTSRARTATAALSAASSAPASTPTRNKYVAAWRGSTSATPTRTPRCTRSRPRLAPQGAVCGPTRGRCLRGSGERGSKPARTPLRARRSAAVLSRGSVDEASSRT